MVDMPLNQTKLLKQLQLNKVSVNPSPMYWRHTWHNTLGINSSFLLLTKDK